MSFFYGWHDASGDPGETVTFTCEFATSETFDLSASNFSSNAGDITGVSVGSFTDNVTDGTVMVEVTVTVGSSHQYSRLLFQAEVDELVEGTNHFTIDFTESIDETVIAPDPVTVTGAPGSSQTFTSFISPSANFQLDATTFATDTLPEGLNTVTFLQQGFSVAMIVNVTIPVLNNQTSTVNITGNTPTAIPTGTLVSTLTMNFSEATSNMSLYPTNWKLQGVAGTTGNFPLLVESASGYTLDKDTVTASEDTPSALVDIANSVQNGEDVILPITWTLPGTDGDSSTVDVTISGAPVLVGGPKKDITLTFNTSGLGTNASINQDPAETLTMPLPSSIRYDVQIAPDSGWEFSGTPTVVSNDPAVCSVKAITDAGGGVYNAQLEVMCTVSNGTGATLTIAGTLVEEGYRYSINVNSSGLTYASINSPAVVSQSFGVGDLTSRELEDITFQVISTNSSHAFTSADEVDVTFKGVGLIKSFNSGVITFTASPTIAADVTQETIADFEDTLVVSGQPVEADPNDEIIEVTVNFEQHSGNSGVSISPTTATVAGLHGTSYVLWVTVAPTDSANEVLPGGNVTYSDTSGIIDGGPEIETGIQFPFR